MTRRPGRGGALDGIVEQARPDRSRLDSNALGPLSLAALGIASVIGAGIFVVVGQAAAEFAGPAVAISLLLACLVALVTALSYAEFASMIPAAGSTYSYAYAVFGLFVAWLIGWDLLLEPGRSPSERLPSRGRLTERQRVAGRESAQRPISLAPRDCHI